MPFLIHFESKINHALSLRLYHKKLFFYENKWTDYSFCQYFKKVLSDIAQLLFCGGGWLSSSDSTKPLCKRAVRNKSKGTSACLSPMQDKHGRQQPTAQGRAACGRHGISSPCKLGAPLMMLLRVQLIVLAEVKSFWKHPGRVGEALLTDQTKRPWTTEREWKDFTPLKMSGPDHLLPVVKEKAIALCSTALEDGLL